MTHQSLPLAPLPAPLPTSLPVAVIGAGPIGLAAAAHLLARGLEPLVLEAAPTIAANMRDWGHVRLFTPWGLNIDRAARALLEEAGWQAPPAEDIPTGAEIVDRYLRPLAALPQIADRLRLGHRVTAITRQGFDKVKTAGRESAPFVLRVATPEGEREILAGAVLDASGTWATPNPLGANGLPAAGETAHASRIAYGIPDLLGTAQNRYARKRVLVVGGGDSAANILLDLAKLAERHPGTAIVWALRSPDLPRVFLAAEADALAARGSLRAALRRLRDSGTLQVLTGFAVGLVETDGDRLAVASLDGRRIGMLDEIVAATGQRPDLSVTRELRLRLDPWLESAEALGPLIDPNLHSCGTVRPHGVRELSHPEPGFYTVGIKSYGRAPTFLMATGYEQVRSVAAFLAGDHAGAEKVELVLPETGVCASDQAISTVRAKTKDSECCAVACCGGAAA